MQEKVHRIIPGLLLLAGVLACHHPADKHRTYTPQQLLRFVRDYRLIATAKPLLQNGDLILRTGNDFISLSLRLFSRRDQTYSHGGLVLIENGRPYVYHAIGGEDDPGNSLQKDSFEKFCDPHNNFGFGVFRYSLSAEEHKKLTQAILHYYQLHTPFDMQFNLAKDDSLYCSEFIYRSLQKATGDSNYIPLTRIRNFTFVAIDNLFLNDHCHPVFRAQY